MPPRLATRILLSHPQPRWIYGRGLRTLARWQSHLTPGTIGVPPQNIRKLSRRTMTQHPMKRTLTLLTGLLLAPHSLA